jgi:hypothetical protein
MKLTHIGWLTVIAIILKLTGYIAWPWWVILIFFEIGLFLQLIIWGCELWIYLTETEEERVRRHLREKIEAYRIALGRRG